jgi:NAD(P)H-quinone oxidoreductase subunit 4
MFTHILSVLIWLPLVGAALVGLLPDRLVRRGAIAVSTALVLLTALLLTQFALDQPGWQLLESLAWLPDLGLNYRLAVDGLSLPLVALVNLLTLAVMLNASVGLKSGTELIRPKLFYALVLLANGGMAGALLAQNLLLFFLFYELELIPFYLLIAIWGSAKREYAATKFLIYTALSGILILAAFLATTWLSGAASFDYDVVRAAIATRQPTQLTPTLQLTLLGLLIVGFGIKLPLIPLHSWLPDAYVESSTPVAMLLGGMLSKLGAYGLLRFALGLFPETWATIAPVMATLAVVSILYGSIAAIAQHDIKRMVAYSSIGHMGYVILGAAALTPMALVGVVAQLVSHGLILGLLFYLVGIIESKVGTRELDQLNGLLNPIRGLPLTSALLILAAMASAGIPGLAGFIAEFLVFQGSFAAYPGQTLLAILGTGLTAVYFVILLNRTCFGKLDNATAYYPKVTWTEHFPALALAALIVWLGIQPTWVLRWSESTTAALATGRTAVVAVGNGGADRHLLAINPRPSSHPTLTPLLSKEGLGEVSADAGITSISATPTSL